MKRLSIKMVRQLLKQKVLCLSALGVCWNVAAGTAFYPSHIFSSTQAVAAVTSGDFDPVHPGNELACLRADGSVVELALGESGWNVSTIFVYPGAPPIPWEDPRTRVTLNLGDVLSGNPGREIVLSFYRQIVVVWYAPPNGWTNRVIADFSDAFGTPWGTEVGDCDRSQAGDEVFSIFEGVFDFSSGTVFGERNGVWEQNLVYNAEVGMDAAIGDANPDVAGDEIIVVTEMGPAYEIMPPPEGGPGLWPQRTIWNDAENAGWVVKIGDVDPHSPGNEIVYGTRHSDRIMMSRHNGTNMHQVEVLLTGVNTNVLNSMFDVAIGQVLPGSAVAEIVGVDASGSVYSVERMTDTWEASVLWRDTNALYAIVTDDFIPTPGDEVIVAGASGVVTLLSNPAPVLHLGLTPEKQAVLSWNAISGLTYSVEMTTNLVSDSWRSITNLVYQSGFYGKLSYTNAQADTASDGFFRVVASPNGKLVHR